LSHGKMFSERRNRNPIPAVIACNPLPIRYCANTAGRIPPQRVNVRFVIRLS
jgi:hypothetical protein